MIGTPVARCASAAARMIFIAAGSSCRPLATLITPARDRLPSMPSVISATKCRASSSSLRSRNDLGGRSHDPVATTTATPLHAEISSIRPMFRPMSGVDTSTIASIPCSARIAASSPPAAETSASREPSSAVQPAHTSGEVTIRCSCSKVRPTRTAGTEAPPATLTKAKPPDDKTWLRPGSAATNAARPDSLLAVEAEQPQQLGLTSGINRLQPRVV
jgi:hypothetical protein